MGKKALIIAYQQTFGTVHGQKVLKDLCARCYEMQPTYVDQNPTGTAYKEGRRGVMLYIRSLINSNPFEEKQKEAIQ